ncbi:MAG: glycosyltransferase family 2 protein [Rhodothermales bacterium]
MDCSTIVVNYNTWELTVDAVRSALAGAGKLQHEVIVVDNGSTDDSVKQLESAFAAEFKDNVSLIVNEENHGFSKGNNIGASAARGDVLFFLNSDTIVHDSAIEVLYHFVRKRPEAGLVGPLVLNADGTEQASTFAMLTAFRIIRHNIPIWSLILGKDKREDYVPSQTEPVDSLNGCAIAVRREVFERIGRWDESYFMYAEDRELSFAALQHGLVNYFCREASITHYGGASSWKDYHKQQVVALRSALEFLRRHHGRTIRAVFRISGAIGFGLRVPIFGLWERSRPELAEDYRRRKMAAAELFHWFVREFK